ncbi:MAG: PAS domain-containing protein, partial [Candidatus Aenigmarchaeota archaeon]|nr:PAS domain-containing protein [Candidatus Aenigmarchaeota archaeon]
MKRKQASKKSDIALGSGTLSRKEMEALLNTLPLDITFVDAKGTVRYFSQSPSRIFARTPAVIGRKVQQCHPPKSIGKVNEILSGFKSGKSNAANFWINLKGRPSLKEGVTEERRRQESPSSHRRLQSLIYIRYFAVRDGKGKYLGCLEVTQ